MNDTPKGELALQVVAMPADTNPTGDVFGGWLLSQMDIAGGVYCRKVVKGRIATVAINSIKFREPVFVGDILSCYVELVRIGHTSITVHIEAWVNREFEEENILKVTEGNYTYVKVDENRKPSPIKI